MQKSKSSILVKQQKTSSASSRRKLNRLLNSAEIESLSSNFSLTTPAKEALSAFPRSSSKATLRTHQIPPPLPLSPSEIVEIRTQVHASQAVFAAYLGVSKATVVAWERGQRKPSGAALRLLTLYVQNPGSFFELL